MEPDDAERDWTAVFTEVHASEVPDGVTRVMAKAMGEEFPRQAQPYSWVSQTELADIARVVEDTGSRLTDVGCGRGGPGLWVAATTGAHLTGIDIARTGLDAAAEKAALLGVEAEFAVGSFADLPLDDASTDVVMSIDAFLFEPDKAAGAREVARVLRPGGRLVMTSWDYHTQPVGRPPQVDDHRPLLEAVGLIVERYDDTHDWERRQRSFQEGLLARADELAAETGQDVEDFRAGVREMAATTDCMIRRFFLVARRDG